MSDKLTIYFKKCTPSTDWSYDPQYDLNEFLKAIELVAHMNNQEGNSYAVYSIVKDLK